MSVDDLDYFLMRTRQEKEAARSATCVRARECHEELASAYELRCRFLRMLNRSVEERRVRNALESHGF